MKPLVAETEQQGKFNEMIMKGQEGMMLNTKLLTTSLMLCACRSDGYEHCHTAKGRKQKDS